MQEFGHKRRNDIGIARHAKYSLFHQTKNNTSVLSNINIILSPLNLAFSVSRGIVYVVVFSIARSSALVWQAIWLVALSMLFSFWLFRWSPYVWQAIRQAVPKTILFFINYFSFPKNHSCHSAKLPLIGSSLFVDVADAIVLLITILDCHFYFLPATKFFFIIIISLNINIIKFILVLIDDFIYLLFVGSLWSYSKCLLIRLRSSITFNFGSPNPKDFVAYAPK